MKKRNINYTNDEIRVIIANIKNMQERIGNQKIIDIFEKSVLKIKNPELSCWFVENIEGADMQAHEQIVLDSKSIFWNLEFARYVEGADIKAHGQLPRRKQRSLNRNHSFET